MSNKGVKILYKTDFPYSSARYNQFDNHKWNLLLDLDSTLISALSLDKEVKKVPESLRNSFKTHRMEKYYDIMERPKLQQFLDYAFANYNVSIMTAADKDYALFIAENIILAGHPERKLKYFFYGYHSALSESMYNSPKDLRILWDILKIPGLNKTNTIILDDNELVYKANPENTIRAPPFELLDEHDKVHEEVIVDNWLVRLPYIIDAKKHELSVKYSKE